MTFPKDHRMCDSIGAAQLRIAIVEDDDANRAGLQRLLELDGHKVTAAANGHAGLALIHFDAPDVALIDIGLPDMNGLEVARRLRRDTGNGTIVLVALTGWGHAMDIVASGRAGFDAHLVKPVNVAELDGIFGRIGLAYARRGATSTRAPARSRSVQGRAWRAESPQT